MRRTLLPIVAVTLFLCACEQRENMAIVPDRQGFARNEAVTTPITMTQVPRQGEEWYVVPSSDTKLYQVAKERNTTIAALVERNKLDTENLKSGQQLIVPKMVGGAPAKPVQAAPAPEAPVYQAPPKQSTPAPAPAPKPKPKTKSTTPHKGQK